MHLIDYDFLAVDDKYELIRVFILLEDVIKDGAEVILILEVQVALALILRVVFEPCAPSVTVCVGFYLDSGYVLTSEHRVRTLGRYCYR